VRNFGLPPLRGGDAIGRAKPLGIGQLRPCSRGTIFYPGRADSNIQGMKPNFLARAGKIPVVTLRTSKNFA
jgi:hypothetical protein